MNLGADLASRGTNKETQTPLLMQLSMSYGTLEQHYANEISGAASDTTSLSSSFSKYRFENGRRYHAYKDGLYLFVTNSLARSFHVLILYQRQPNDEKQLSVQDLG